jgi:hypothetical protein
MIDSLLLLWPGVNYANTDIGIVPIDLNSMTPVILGAPDQNGFGLSALRSAAGVTVAISFDNNILLAALTLASGSPILASEVRVLNDLGDATDAFGLTLGAGLLPGLPEINCDLDADARDELFAGSSGRAAGPGAAELFYRSSLLTHADTGLEVARSTSNYSSQAASGTRAVACIGDINGDGAADLLTADAAANSNAGGLTVYY